MRDLSHIHDKKFSVIFVEEDGSEHGNWSLLTGIAKWQDPHLVVHRGMDFPEFPIPDGTLDRVKEVPPEIRECVGDADYYTMLTVGPLPPDADPGELEHTGIRIPRREPKMVRTR